MSGVYYNQAKRKPHKRRYGLHAEPDTAAAAQMVDLTMLYTQAPAIGNAGERVLSTDAMPDIQALERYTAAFVYLQFSWKCQDLSQSSMGCKLSVPHQRRGNSIRRERWSRT